MVPSAYVMLDAFPLTPNGKLDRRALPAPDQSSVVTQAYEAPQGELETAIAEIWQDLLGLPRIGRNDHFFALGGYSLLVLQVIGRIYRKYSVSLPIRSLFEEPVLSRFAYLINELLSLSPMPNSLEDGTEIEEMEF
jgi:hypothetical protein